jgi:predicted dinucleotide-utilizing enzyme
MRVEEAPTAGHSISPSRPRVSSLLEIGGGVGKLQIELLKRGAARAVDLELSAAYEQEAKSLLREAGLEERAERRLHHIAMDPEGDEAADVVVCCTGWSAVTRITSDCWEGRRSTLGVCSCSVIRRATPSRVCLSRPRTSS